MILANQKGASAPFFVTLSFDKINICMIEMYKNTKTNLTEGKYGYKFDQFKAPFKNEGKFIVDSNGKQLGEFKNAELAKEMASILSDLPKVREAAERLATIWR